jgi:hypothetical protein
MWTWFLLMSFSQIRSPLLPSCICVQKGAFLPYSLSFNPQGDSSQQGGDDCQHRLDGSESNEQNRQSRRYDRDEKRMKKQPGKQASTDFDEIAQHPYLRST